MTSSVDRASEAIAQVLSGLQRLNGDARAVQQLLGMLGWEPPSGVDDIGLAGLDLSAVISRIDALTELRSLEETSDLELAAAVAELIVALADAYRHIEDVAASFQAPSDYLDRTGIADEFFVRLADVIAINALGSFVPAAVPVGVLLGVFELRTMPADPAIFQCEHLRQIVHWGRFSLLLSHPQDVLRDVYGWGTSTFDGNALIVNLGRVLEYLADDVRLRALPRPAEEQIVRRPAPEADSAPAAQILVSLSKDLGIGAADVGLTLYAVRPSMPGANDGGLGLSPYAFGTTETAFELSGGMSLALSADAGFQDGLALILRAGRDPELMAGMLDPASAPMIGASFALTLRHAVTSGARQVLFSAPGLDIDVSAISAGVGVVAGSVAEPSLHAAIEGGRIRVSPDREDGFLAAIVPEDGIEIDVDLSVEWSRRGGVRIRGGAGLKTTIPIHRKAGPLSLTALEVGIDATPQALRAKFALSGSATLGPVTATVNALGAAAALRFERGNLGPVDFGVDFLPPDGIGLTVDAGGVLAGGGFLFHDSAQALYGGAMRLSLYEHITLKAFGLIATRMPDGSKGYSLTVFMTAEDFKPIQIGMGFALLGIGGMIGIHRRFDEVAMRESLGNGTLGNLLFPRDPVANAPEIIRSLSTIFPAQRGSYLLGVLAKIGWLSPPLVTMDLALIYQFGLHRRLIALGRIQSLLPTRDNALIQLNLDAFGVIDFDDGSVSIDAVLVDSRLAHRFVMTGDMAMRARWGGSGGGFVLAVGGLNPHFTPPTGLPTLKRMTIALSAGDNPRLTCEAYFAITANTLQFGARAQLYAAAIGFSVEGEVGFDVLVQWLPFHFLADFHASLQLKRGSRNLFKVSVAGALEGPRPLRISGKASFEILWCDFTVRFDKTLVEGQAPPLPPAVNVLDQLSQALADAHSWTTQRDAQQQHGVALRKLPPGAPGLVLDPLGTLTVKQQVVPLNTTRDVELFGGAPVAGARRFALAATFSGSHSAQVQDEIKDLFAPAQFFPMSDAEKLASPSFEEMQAGLRFGSDEIAFDDAGVVASPLQFETLVIDAAGESSRPKGGEYTPSKKRLDLQVRAAAVAHAPLRHSGQARFRDRGGMQIASLRTPRWVATSIADTSVRAPGVRSDLSWSEQHAAVIKLNRGEHAWQLMLELEI